MEENVIILNNEIAINSSNEEIANAMLKKEGVKLLKGNIKKIVVDEPTLSKKGYEYRKITITLTKAIPCYLADEQGNYTLQESAIIYSSVDVLSAVMREDKTLSGIVNSIAKSPSVVELLLDNADVDIIQQDVPAGVKFVNPFSNIRDISEYSHNIMSNSITKIKLSDENLENVREIKRAILASCLR